MAFETIDPPTAHERMAGDATYLDVRTAGEFRAGRPAGAVNIPVMTTGAGGMIPNPAFVASVTARFAKDSILVVGCKMGGRSHRACQLLEAEGFTRLGNVHGGFSGAPDQVGWSDLGLPVEKD